MDVASNSKMSNKQHFYRNDGGNFLSLCKYTWGSKYLFFTKFISHV